MRDRTTMGSNKYEMATASAMHNRPQEFCDEREKAMRMSALTLIFVLSFQPAGYAATRDLAPTVEILARAAAEIKAGIAKETDIKAAAKAQAIQEKIESLWLEAVSVQVDTAEDKLKELGLYPKADDGNGFQFVVASNAKGEGLKKKAQQLEMSGWPEVLAAAKEGLRQTAESRSLLEQDRFKDGISEAVKDEANRRFSSYKDNAFEGIRLLAERTIECMSHVAQQTTRLGLKPVLAPNGRFEWSSDDLRRVYGITSLEAASSEQKKRMGSGINSILNLRPKTFITCISPEEMDFLNSEYAKLEGAR